MHTSKSDIRMSMHFDVVLHCSTHHRRDRRSWLRPLLCLAFALAFANIGCKRAAPPEAEKVPPAPVKWEALRQTFPEEWTELIGSTQPLPNHAARVTAPVSGRVVAVLPKHGDKLVAEGQAVDEGDVLVQLDASAVQANLAKAQAAKKVLQAERDVATLALKQAQVDLKSLEELKRTQSSQTVLVSPVMLEKASLALDSAQASVVALDRKLEAADKDEAALNVELKLYTLTAPRKGRLGRLQVVVGQTLSAGAPVAEVLSIDAEIDVLCFVSATDSRKLEIDQPAQIGGLGKDAVTGPAGKVVFISDQAETETGSFAVKIRFPNSDLKLRASAVTRVRILTKPGRAAWSVPESALLEDQDPPSIIVVEDVVVAKNADGKEEQTGKARRLQAIIGVRDRVLGQVEIVRLIDPEKKWRGEVNETVLIVISKGQGLQTGDAVKFEEDDDDDAPKPEEKP
jgi:RND family efflux transporter MFP subunit